MSLTLLLITQTTPFPVCFQTTIQAIQAIQARFPPLSLPLVRKEKPSESVTQRNELKCHPRPLGIPQPCVRDPVLRAWASVKTEGFKTQHPETSLHLLLPAPPTFFLLGGFCAWPT